MGIGGLPSVAQSADTTLAPLNIQAKYVIAWNGITIGRINFTATEKGSAYHMVIDTKTHGIGSMFSSEKRVAEAMGQITKNGHYLPTQYRSRPQGQEGGRVTSLTYDNKGHLTNRSRVPDDDAEWRPPVAFEKANEATDPLTAGLVLRRKLHEELHRQQLQTGVKTYDGARLAEMRFTVQKPVAKVAILGSYVATVTTLVNRQPIAGYTPKEIKAFNKGDPVIHLYFSDDAQFIPVQATVGTGFGQLSASLKELQTAP